MFSSPRQVWHLPAHYVGQRVLIYDRVDSTNTIATNLAIDSANGGIAVLADEQTAGRGQYGRTWHSPPGLGVWLSLLLFPPAALRRPAILTAWAAVAIAECVRQTTGKVVTIRWPNDVQLRGRKVCGVLIEQGRGTVVGIGLNVNQTLEQLSDAGLLEATSLAIESGRSHERDRVARLLLKRLDDWYCQLVQGNLATLESAWGKLLGVVGKTVTVETTDGACQRGHVRALTFDRLELHLADGAVVCLAPERVRHLRAVPE